MPTIAPMFMRRRRPLARAAMIGGTAYVAGRAGQRAAMRQQEAQQQAVEQEQPPPSAPQGADLVAQLTELKGLLDSGVLTQAEFEAAKRQLLAS